MNPRYTNTAGVINLNENNLSRSQESFLRFAKRTAEASECAQRHGAVIVRGGSVLAVGINKWRNEVELMTSFHDNGQTEGISVHAEIDALNRVKNPQGATIYIARVNKQGKGMMSMPCNNCAKALKEAGITKVIYTVS